MAKTRRVKSDRQLVKLSGWKSVDNAVRKIGTLQRDIENAGTKATDKIEAIKAQLAEDVKAAQDGVKICTESIEAWVVAHRKELKNKQSRKLNHGTIGWRKSTAISVKKTTVGLLKKVLGRKASQYLHVKETPDREAMAGLTDEQLATVGARRRHKDVFFVAPDIIEAADYG